jgi:glycerol-1-phosphate dehydrogenase [NAD(P)+]
VEVATGHVRIERGALGRSGELFAAAFGDRPAVVVADETTYEVAGRAVAAVDAFVFPARPTLHADFEHVLELEEWLREHDAVPVAVGAGTLNDLTKLAAHRLGRPYMCVATAASVDGFSAFGASITREGFKQTMACPAPRALLADLDVLAAAPGELNASGYADLLGKVTAGADWLVADRLGAEPIDRAGWEMVQGPLRSYLAGPERVAAGEPEAVGRLFEGLFQSGLAMQKTRSSRVASGAEHLLSHLWDMGGLGVRGDAVSHGFKVGVGSVLVAQLYDRLLMLDLEATDLDARVAAQPPLAEVEAEVRQLLADPRAAEPALAEVRAKHPSPDVLRERLERLRTSWPELRAALRAQLTPPRQLAGMLRAAGAPSEPAEIGVSAKQARASLRAARLIRRRYTVLDLAWEAGALEAVLP